MKTQIKNSVRVLCMLLLAGSIMFTQSCKKSVNQVPGTIVGYDNSKKVTSSLSGVVLDESGIAIENAVVSISGNNTTTDANGFYNFNNISIPQHNATVKVSKATYFTGYKSFVAQASQKHIVRVTLMKKDAPEVFSTSNGGTVSFSGGLNITFPANGIINKQNGAAYNGQVYVYAKTIDPTTATGFATMPGDLRGVSATNNEEKVLASFGMLVAELYDQNGNALQIASNSKATISLDIPASLTSIAAATIPMWSFDETKEIWVEEGTATKQGNKYVGDVTHFTFWNYDAQLPAVNFDLTLQDQNGNPIPYAYVSIHNVNNAGGHGTTNSAGWASGMIEANATLTLTVYSSSYLCGNQTPIYTQSVTTGASNVSLGTIVVNITPVSTITGSIIDCSNNPVSNGSVVILPGYQVVNANASGQFSILLPCTPTVPITITAYDNTAGVYGNVSSPISIVAGTNNIGNFAACGNVTPFLTMSFTNTVLNTTVNQTFNAPTSYILADADVSTGKSFISIYDSLQGGGTSKYVNFQAADSTIGTHNILTFNTGGVLNASWTDTQFTLSTVTTNTVTYTSFPLAPGQVLGSYSVTLIGSPSGHTYTATGTFRAQR